jgi:probable FeS assembly SUF system protein SufT
MHTNEVVLLSRDCEATQVPSGERLMLPAGSSGTVTQALGGTYTLVTDEGYMVRIAAKDAGAIGKESATESPDGLAAAPESPEQLERLVWDQLRSCYDPEIPTNIADLGLVYSCVISLLPEGGNKVEVKFTLTAPGCGMGDSLKADVESAILSVPGVKEVDAEVVFDPPWDMSMIPEATRLQLGMM